MNYTLLEATQLILSALDSDEVSSIDNTVESTQVALLLKSVFYDIASEISLPQNETLLELTASGDNTKPTLMTVPSTTARICWIKYDNKASADTYKDYQDVHYLDFSDFVQMQNSLRDKNATNVGEMVVSQNGESFDIMYRTDKHPTWYTTTNHNQVIFDSFDSTVDVTLQKSKTMCLGYVYPTWSMTNTFVPPLEPQQFSYWINKAKTRAFMELKQQPNQEAQSEARRQKIALQKRKTTINTGAPVYGAPRYGRK